MISGQQSIVVSTQRNKTGHRNDKGPQCRANWRLYHMTCCLPPNKFLSCDNKNIKFKLYIMKYWSHMFSSSETET